MASNWAIVIGINQYRFLQPLNYAKRDAEAMCNFLTQEARFDRIFLFTDDSPAIGGKSTEPFRANLLRVLRQIFAAPFMKDGDNFWFFFSGHGIPHNGQDYLMPLDGDPEDIENTGISTNTITNYLRSCGADNAVMILDACRSGGKKSGEGIGRQTEAEARQTGVISLFSCSPDQYSYELEAIEQGAFTYALLEGLGIRGRCATVERLNQYLEHRVPELVSQHLQRARQIPYTIAEPLNRSHLILMPQHASLADIATLKNDAYRAQMKQDWELAQRLWIRVNAAASGQDMEAIEAFQTTAIDRWKLENIKDTNDLVTKIKSLPGVLQNNLSLSIHAATNGSVTILGPRASGKMQFLATLTHFIDTNGTGQLINDDASELAKIAKHILKQGLQLAPAPPNRIDDLYCMSLTLKPENFSSIQASIKLQLNYAFSCATGYFFDALIHDRYLDNDSLFETFIELCSSSNMALVIDARDSDSDCQIAQALKKLEDILDTRLKELEKNKYRIAVMFSCFDQPEVWEYRSNPSAFAKLKFPQTRLTLHNWSDRWACSIVYFAFSSLGMLGSSKIANAESETGSRWSVLKDPDHWKPFGLIEPLYWLLTGEHINQSFHFSKD